jgi:Smr domain
MKFQSGDKIALKSNAEEGVFVRVIDAKMVMISINNTEFPVFESEIEHPYFNWFTSAAFKKPKSEKKYIDNIPKEKQKGIPMVSQGMQLVFMPVYKNMADDDVIEKVKIYLSNQQAQAYSFHYYFESKDGENFRIDSEVASFTDFYLHDISYEHLATNPLFDISCAAIISNITSSINQYQEQFTIKPKKIFNYVQQMHMANQAFFAQLLFNEAPPLAIIEPIVVKPWAPPAAASIIPKKIEQKISATEKVILPVPAEKQKLPELAIETYFTNPFEIDLHIENLCADHINMSSAEKNNFQLQVFTKALDTAICRAQNSLIVIHGVGKGVLKNEIHGILNQTKEVHSYVNQHDNRFGFGATEIFFGY